MLNFDEGRGWVQFIEIIDIERVLGHESCLHFFLSMSFEIRHIEFGEKWELQSLNNAFVVSNFALLFIFPFI